MNTSSQDKRAIFEIVRSKLIVRIFVYFVFIVAMLRQDFIFAEDNPPRVELKEDGIYLDGKKFLIKGVGYSPYRPGQWPGSAIAPEIAEEDFKRIKEAGFNTLRVWDIMPAEQLKLAEKYGLKVIQAVYLKPDVDFGYSGYIRLAESRTRQMCRISKDHPNVIMYLIMNEPHAKAVINSGVDNTLNLYKRLIDIIKEEDPSRPVSMANAYWTLWLDQSAWDVVSFNVYNFSPLVEDIGYANFVKNLKSLHSARGAKPLVVTEFGFSVSPEGGSDYGGNTEREQADGLIGCFRQILEGGAAGGCVFEWNDEWWKAGNPNIHDGHPEEWFGIIGIEGKSDPLGTPREAYHRLKDEFKLVVTKPKEGGIIFDREDIEINAADGISDVKYRIDDKARVKLHRDENWWRGTIDVSGMEPGPHKLTVEGFDSKKSIERHINIIISKSKREVTLPLININLTTDKPSYKNGDIMTITAALTDRDGKPLANHLVRAGVFDVANTYNRYWEGRTDKHGVFSKSIPVRGRLDEWYYAYGIGTDIEYYGHKNRAGSMGYVKANRGDGFPVKSLSAKKAGRIKIDGEKEEAWTKADKIMIDADAAFVEGDIESYDDISGAISLLWDKSYLYILADVKDDIPLNNDCEGIDLWKGDCLELFISVDPGKIPERGYSGSDFQILIGTNGNMWIPGQAKDGVRNSVPVSSKAVAKRSDMGYILEAGINISNFYDEPEEIFEKGDILGFDVAIGDRDLGGLRESKLIWNGTEEGYKDSAVWGRLILE